MKAKIYFIKKTLFSLFIILSVISCQKNDLDVKPQDSGTSSGVSEIVTNKSGFLEFKDMQIFKQTVEELKALTTEKRIAWEKEHDFTSLKSVYDEVLKDETKLFNSLKINFKDIDKVNPNLFPNVHSVMFESCSNSIISTGEKIIDIPQANIGITEYAGLVNKDGLVRISNGLFQFKKGVIKMMKIDENTNANDISSFLVTERSNEKIKILDSRPKNKNAKVAQNGSGGTMNLVQGYLVTSWVEYSDQLVIANSGDPGAFNISFLGFNLWVAPVVVCTASMHVNNNKFWYHSEGDCPVYISGTANGGGRTNNDGNFQVSNTYYGISVANGLYSVREAYYIYPYFPNGILAGVIDIYL